MQITEVCKSIGAMRCDQHAYLRLQVSGSAVRSFPAATMAGYQSLSDLYSAQVRWGIASPRYQLNLDLRVRPFYECTVTSGYPVKRRNSDIDD